MRNLQNIVKHDQINCYESAVNIENWQIFIIVTYANLIKIIDLEENLQDI